MSYLARSSPTIPTVRIGEPARHQLQPEGIELASWQSKLKGGKCHVVISGKFINDEHATARVDESSDSELRRDGEVLATYRVSKSLIPGRGKRFKNRDVIPADVSVVYSIDVDADDVVSEANEVNNTATVTVVNCA